MMITTKNFEALIQLLTPESHRPASPHLLTFVKGQLSRMPPHYKMPMKCSLWGFFLLSFILYRRRFHALTLLQKAQSIRFWSRFIPTGSVLFRLLRSLIFLYALEASA